MRMSLPSWLDQLILKSAAELERGDKTIFQFAEAVRKTLDDKPIQAWELDRWSRGLKRGLIRLHKNFFRVGSGQRSSLSFFIRNEQDRLVGLRRESITQAATFVSLITDYGYPRESTRFETGWMDVAVFRPDGQALIYAENKANARTLEKLCDRLRTEFGQGVPFQEGDERPKDDALNKAQHIWRHRPAYFWAVSPTTRHAYRVQYHRGFELSAVDHVPSALEWALE